MCELLSLLIWGVNETNADCQGSRSDPNKGDGYGISNLRVLSKKTRTEDSEREERVSEVLLAPDRRRAPTSPKTDALAFISVLPRRINDAGY